MAKIKFEDGITLGLEVPEMEGSPLPSPSDLMGEALTPEPSESPSKPSLEKPVVSLTEEDLRPVVERLELLKREIDIVDEKVDDNHEDIHELRDNILSVKEKTTKNKETLSQALGEVRTDNTLRIENSLNNLNQIDSILRQNAKINIALGIGLLISLILHLI